MGSLRRTTSVSNVAIVRKSGPCAYEKDKICIPENYNNYVDCGYCTLSFEYGGPSAPADCGHLVIRLSGNKVCSDDRLLVESLDRVLETQQEWVVTYDFRLGQPSQRVAKLFEESRERIAKHARTIAVLIAENIYVAGAKRFIGGFMSFLPRCPAIVCHCEHIAKEFFRAITTTSIIASAFVSVVAIKDDPRGRLHPRSFAVMEPTLSKSGDSPKVDATLHTMPNGDVRVIQTPARDVLMCKEGECRQGKNGLQLQSTGRTSTLVALRFPCRKELLGQLVGAYFHVGELIADAEAESQDNTKIAVHRTAPPTSCFGDILRSIAWMCWSDF